MFKRTNENQLKRLFRTINRQPWNFCCVTHRKEKIFWSVNDFRTHSDALWMEITQKYFATQGRASGCVLDAFKRRRRPNIKPHTTWCLCLYLDTSHRLLKLVWPRSQIISVGYPNTLYSCPKFLLHPRSKSHLISCVENEPHSRQPRDLSRPVRDKTGTSRLIEKNNLGTSHLRCWCFVNFRRNNKVAANCARLSGYHLSFMDTLARRRFYTSRWGFYGVDILSNVLLNFLAAGRSIYYSSRSLRSFYCHQIVSATFVCKICTQTTVTNATGPTGLNGGSPVVNL